MTKTKAKQWLKQWLKEALKHLSTGWMGMVMDSLPIKRGLKQMIFTTMRSQGNRNGASHYQLS